MPGMNKPAATRRCLVSSALLAIVLLPGCDLLTVSQTGRNIREGNAAVVRGEYQRGVQYYESALDGTMLSAEAHYRLGLVYEDHLKNQVAALHHFERYLELAPQGQFATDVKGYVERLRLVIVSSLADGTVLPAKEASRLKNENLELRQQVAELRQRQSPSRSAPAPTPAPPTPTPAMTVAATPPPLPADATPQPEIRRAEPVARNRGACRGAGCCRGFARCRTGGGCAARSSWRVRAPTRWCAATRSPGSRASITARLRVAEDRGGQQGHPPGSRQTAGGDGVENPGGVRLRGCREIAPVPLAGGQCNGSRSGSAQYFTEQP